MDVYGFCVKRDLIENRGRKRLMFSSMLGSLTFYRRILHENVFSNPNIFSLTPSAIQNRGKAGEHAATKLPVVGHGLAGIMAGATVSFIAAPVEHIKARLQIQYAVDKSKRLYSGPIDCTRKIVSSPLSDDRGIPFLVAVT